MSHLGLILPASILLQSTLDSQCISPGITMDVSGGASPLQRGSQPGETATPSQDQHVGAADVIQVLAGFRDGNPIGNAQGKWISWMIILE